MGDSKAMEVIDSNHNMIKPATSAEKVAEKIRMLEKQNVDTRRACETSNAIYKAKRKTLRYTLNHLRWNYELSSTQIKALSADDWYDFAEVVLAEKKVSIILLGWIPIFGWQYAIKYILFKRRIKFLKSCNENIFYESAIADIYNWLNPPNKYHGGYHGP